MRTVDRQGLQIEQCENCRGIFLDHGELEQMVSAEDRYYGAASYVPPGGHGGHRGGHSDSPRPFRGGHSDSPRPYRGGGHSDSPRPYRGGGHSDSPAPYGHRRQKSFLGDLFG
jgi:Zn-finger nucleic acid-binding protein